jgi:hypothetical protein
MGLSRDQEDIAGLFKRLRFDDIRIVTLAEREISELHVGLKGWTWLPRRIGACVAGWRPA